MRKSIVFGLMLILLTCWIVGEVQAAPTCGNCGTVTQPCSLGDGGYRCPNCGWLDHYHDEHTHSYILATSAGSAGHYVDRCACGDRKSGATLQNHTFTTSIQMGVTRYDCSVCKYYYFEGGSQIVVPNERKAYYYKIANPSSVSSMNIDIELRSPTQESAAVTGNVLSYTDNIPAGTTRTYIYYLTSSSDISGYSMNPIAVLGYVDGDGTTGNMLMIASPYQTQYSLVRTTQTFTTSAGATEGEWTEVSGSPTITFKASDLVSSNTYLYGGTHGSANSTNQYIAISGVTRGTESYAQKYGSVKLSYTLPDVNPPQLTVNPVHVGNNVVYNISATDDVAVTSLSINGTSKTLTDGAYIGEYTHSSEGIVNIIARDAAGNQKSYTNTVTTIKYNLNGGTGNISTMYKASGIDRYITTTIPTKTNYNFASWNTSVDGTGDSYSAGSMYSLNTNLILYAKWNNSDTLAPTGTITLGGTYHEANGYKYVKSGVVTLNLTATDNESEQENIKVALINEADYDRTKQNSTITWLDFSATKQWTSSSGKGLKRVYVIFRDEAGNQSVYFAQ